MRGYRPSQFFDNSLDPQVLLNDPERLRRVVIYAERAANGQPLFDEPIPVRVKITPAPPLRRAKAG